MLKNRSVWLGLTGNLLEHYDAALFGLLAPFLAPLFFPSENPIESLILTYALLPMGFLMKPAGAIFFGWFGDRFGRRRALSASLFGMAAATAAIGFIPTHNQIGAWAPALLSLARALQSAFAAGQTAGGAIYILEAVDEKKRVFASSLFDASGILGILIGSAFVTFWSEEWRWMFWAGALTGLIGSALRWDGKEEPPLMKKKNFPFKILWEERVSVISIAMVAGFSYVNYYLITTFMNGFLPQISSITKSQAMELNTLLLCFDMAMLPLLGWAARKVEKEKLMLFAILSILILSTPLFLLLENGSITTAAMVRLTLTFLGVALAAPFHAWAYERAPKEHRFLICAVGTAIGSRMLGAPAPALGLCLYQWTGWIPSATIPVWILGIGSAAFLAVGLRKKLERIVDKGLKMTHDSPISR